ncbi:MAG: cytochrome c [Verrucomicrobia subdivision 3 bacterium]|nr:cytochrome c [Limisphaerales bacterium]
MSRKKDKHKLRDASAGTSTIQPSRPTSGDDREPVAERRPVPVLLIALLVALVFWGELYVMRHGGDIGGEKGAFPAMVYFPFKSYAEIPKPPGGAAEGVKFYGQYCAICHQANGMGIPGQFPPLAGSDWVLEEGPNRVIRLMLNGIQGPITVNGQPFNNAMPPWRDIMDDAKVAAVATYIRSTWGNKVPPVKPEEVKAIRDATADRTSAWSAQELLALPTK